MNTVTLDIDLIGATTLKEIARSLGKELKANNPKDVTGNSDWAQSERVRLRKMEPQIITAISKINARLAS